MAGVISQGAQAAPTGAPGLYVQILPPPPFVAGVPTNVGGLAGSAVWGPINTPLLCGSPSDVTRNFGPVASNPAQPGLPVATTDAVQNPFDLNSAAQLAFAQASRGNGLSLWAMRGVDGPNVTLGTTPLGHTPVLGKFPAAYQLDNTLDGTHNTLASGITSARFATLGLQDTNAAATPVAASVFIASTTSPDGITWTAVTPGYGGNAITITYNAPSGGTSTAVVTGNAIVFSPKTGATNANLISDTAATVAGLVTGVATGGSDDVVTTTLTSLTGGKGPGGYLVALYYGTLGNGINVTISAGAVSGLVVTLIPPGGCGLSAETYSGLPSTSGFWVALQNALANGIAGVRGPSQLCRFVLPAQLISGSAYGALTNSTTAPTVPLASTALSGGIDGTLLQRAASPAFDTYSTAQPNLPASLLGTNATYPNTGLYLFSGLNQPVAAFTIAGFGDNVFGDYTAIGTIMPNIADPMAAVFCTGLALADDTNTSQAVTDIGTIASTDWELVIGKDHVYFNDGVHGSRLMPCSPALMGDICALPPQNSPLNTTVKGTQGTYRTSSIGQPSPYSLGEIGLCQNNGIALITQPIPGGNVLGYATGVNASISVNPITGAIEYSTLTNFLAKSLAGAFGIWIGKNQGPNDPDPTRQGVFSALSTFLQLQLKGNVIAAFGVQCDKGNNSAASIAAHYLYASVTATYFSSVWWFVLSFTGGTNVNVSISQGSAT